MLADDGRDLPPPTTNDNNGVQDTTSGRSGGNRFMFISVAMTMAKLTRKLVAGGVARAAALASISPLLCPITCDAWSGDAPISRRQLGRHAVGVSVVTVAGPPTALAIDEARGQELIEASTPLSLPWPSSLISKDFDVTKTNAIDVSPLSIVRDPSTYEALSYSPPQMLQSSIEPGHDSGDAVNPPPLILVLHGAGKNNMDISELADPRGEHSGLIPSLIRCGTAPSSLVKNFAVLAPYSFGKRSFYEEPRGKLLAFLDWAKSDAGRKAGCPRFDPNRVFLFGFSDGATVSVELLTTGRFSGAVVASYGFTGKLPEVAAQRLRDIPIWVFHSADDVIFPVSASDNLVQRLEQVNSSQDFVVYSRFANDPEDFPPAVRGHTMGITASKQSDVYEWMLRARSIK